MSSTMLSLLLVSLLALQEPAASEDLAEFRGVVLSPDDGDLFTTRAKLAEAVDFLYDAGANVVFPIAWSKEGPLWPSAAAKAAGLPEVDPRVVDPRFKSRDALHELIVEAHRAGLEVVPMLDLTDPKVAKQETALVIELATYLAIDGIAIEAGKGEPATLGARFAALKSALGKIDAGVKLVVVGGTDSLKGSRDWLTSGACDLCMPRIAARDADAWKKGVDAIASGKDASRTAPLFVIADGAWRAKPEFALAALAHDRTNGRKGEILAPFSALRTDDLSSELQREPWYGLALLPWRDGVAWRAHSDTFTPNAGEGQWAWRTDASGVPVLELGGNQAGSVTWTIHAGEKGDYDVFVWIPHDADVGKRAAVQVSTPSGKRSTVIDFTLAKNRGWVYVGTVPMQRREKREALRMEAEEKDPTKLNVAGPAVAILQRRPMPR
jgi:hypothetical protein